MATKRHTGYTSLPQEDPLDIQFKPRKQTASQAESVVERTLSVLHALFWVTLAIISWFYTDIFSAYSDQRVKSIPFGIAVLCGLIALVTFSYVFLDNWCKDSTMNHDLFDAYPKSIYTLTFSGLFFWFFLTVAFYSVWGWKTFPIIFVNFMGFIMGVSLFPL
jgi:hypothetical protein